MNKILQIFSYITILLAFLVVGTISVWLTYPYKTIEFKEPVTMITTEVERGDHILYDVEYCKYTTVTPTVTKTFSDGLIYAVPEVIATDKSLGCRTQRVSMYVPKGLPSGEYYVNATYRYQVNPIRYIDVKNVTEKFIVK